MDVVYQPTSGAGSRGLLATLAGSIAPGEQIYQQDERNPVRSLREQAYNATGMFRAAAPLPPEAGEELDSVVTEVGSDRLAVVAALIKYVERPLANWWGTMTVQHLRNSKQGRARATMYPGGRGARSLVDRTPVSTPIYAFEQDFDYHERFLTVASGAGVQIEDESARAALENINELAEDFAINGPGVQFNAVSTVYGLENAPNANTGTLSGANPAWDHASKTGEEILDDFHAMRDALVADKAMGPYIMFVEKDYESPLGKPYSDGVTTNYGRTVRETLLAEPNLLDIFIVDFLAADKVFLVEAKPRTCGIYMGQDPAWVPMGVKRFQHEFLMLACMVPTFRDDIDGNSGVAEFTV
jgi:hypothetical protein